MISTFYRYQFSGEFGEAVRLPVRISVLNDDIFPVDITQIPQTLPEGFIGRAMHAEWRSINTLCAALFPAAAPRL